MSGYSDIIDKIKIRFPEAITFEQPTSDEFPTLWIDNNSIISVLTFLKNESDMQFRFLYDLSAIDEQARNHRSGQPESKFTVVYLLLSYFRNQFIRLKIGLTGDRPTAPTATSVWKSCQLVRTGSVGYVRHSL